MRSRGSLHVWGGLLLGAGLLVNGFRGAEILGAGALVGVLVGVIAWAAAGRISIGLVAAGLAQGTILAPSLAVTAALVAGVVGIALVLDDVRILVLSGVGLLVPVSGAWLAPIVAAGLLWAWSSPAWRWVGLPLGAIPLVADVAVLELAATLGASLALGEGVRRVAATRANLRQARVLADLGLLAAPAIGLGALFTASVAGLEAFVSIVRWSGFALVAGVTGALAHIGAAAGLRTDTKPSVWLGLTWIPAGTVLASGLTGSLTGALAPALSLWALATPAAALGLASLLGASLRLAPSRSPQEGDNVAEV